MAVVAGSDLGVLEPNADWADLPVWMKAFVAFGHAWDGGTGQRTLLFVSTPLDAPVAGLLVLGAVLRRLAEPDAHDLGSHFSRIVALAKNVNANARFRLRSMPRRARWKPVFREDGSLWMEQCDTADPELRRLIESSAMQWVVDGEPPVEAYDHGAELPYGVLYRLLSPSQAVALTENLRRGDSAVVLAGRATGMTATRRGLEAVKFRAEGISASLAEMISVHEWSRQYVSRARYLTPRASASGSRNDSPFDRPGSSPRLVVADGAAALRAVLRQKECDNADVIAVLPRTIDRDAAEELAADVAAHCRAWYRSDSERLRRYPRLPAGVEVDALVEVEV